MIYSTDEDDANEKRVAGILAEAWGCGVEQFPGKFYVDFYLHRYREVLGVAELKSRTNASTTYPTVWLTLMKWARLTFISESTDTVGVFVAEFTDGIWWIRVNDVDATKIEMVKRKDRNTPSAKEPAILVPISSMRKLVPGQSPPARA